MFLAVHATIGAIGGALLPHPLLSFTAGFLTHFLTDIIPHGDDDIYQQYKKGLNLRKAYLHVGVDAAVTVALVLSMFWFRDFVKPASVIAGIAGAVLPDILVGMFEVMKPKSGSRLYALLAKFHGFHMRNHRHVINVVMKDKKDISERMGFVMQGALMAVLLVILF